MIKYEPGFNITETWNQSYFTNVDLWSNIPLKTGMLFSEALTNLSHLPHVDNSEKLFLEYASDQFKEMFWNLHDTGWDPGLGRFPMPREEYNETVHDFYLPFQARLAQKVATCSVPFNLLDATATYYSDQFQGKTESVKSFKRDQV